MLLRNIAVALTVCCSGCCGASGNNATGSSPVHVILRVGMSVNDALRAFQKVGLVATEPHRAEGPADLAIDVRLLEISPTGWKDVLRVEVLRQPSETVYTVSSIEWYNDGKSDVKLPKSVREDEFEKVEALDLVAVVGERGIGELTAGTGEIFNLERPATRSFDRPFSQDAENK